MAEDMRSFLLSKGARLVSGKNPNVPDQYTVAFGEKVADSFVWLNRYVEKTDFRLNHLEKDLGGAFANMDEMAKAIVDLRTAIKPRRGGKKRYVVLLGVGVYLGVKLANRENQAKLRQVYLDLADRVEAAVSEAVDKADEVKEDVTAKNDKKDAFVDPIVTPEHEVLR
jgi:hypothetical protein